MSKKLGFIIFDDLDMECTCLGFNRFNSKGFIDDGHKWTDEDRDEFYENVILPLGDFIDTGEMMSFTYQILDEDGLRVALDKMGLEEQEAAWLDTSLDEEEDENE